LTFDEQFKELIIVEFRDLEGEHPILFTCTCEKCAWRKRAHFVLIRFGKAKQGEDAGPRTMNREAEIALDALTR
jgi:hypothetical protein